MKSLQMIFAFPHAGNNDFSTFLVDEKNRLVERACRRFAGKKEPGALTLYGESGAGKTHILIAMGALRERSLYLDCADLNHQTQMAESYEQLKKWLSDYEKSAFLAVDHLETIQHNETAQEQVFHLFNALRESGGSFAGAISLPPPRWDFADYLTTRLLWGELVELLPVGHETRAEVLIKISADLGMQLPMTAARWLVTHLPRDPKSQAESLNRINHHSLTVGRKVTIQLVKEAMALA